VPGTLAQEKETTGIMLWPLTAIALALLLIVVIAVLTFSQCRARDLLKPLRKPLEFRPEDFHLPVEDVRIRGVRGTLAAWHVPSLNGCTLICCHGINDNRGQWVRQIARLRERSGYGALMFDFAGHGESDGSMVTYGQREADDVASVLEYLRTRDEVDIDRVGIMGYSLGAITSVLAATKLPELRCVVIESGFADLYSDISTLFRRYTGLPSFPFATLIVFFGQLLSGVRLGEIRPARVIGQLSPRAVMIISDLEDAIANEPEDGDQLYANAGEPRVLWQVARSGHVQAFETYPDEWIERVCTFLDAHLAGAPVKDSRMAHND